MKLMTKVRIFSAIIFVLIIMASIGMFNTETPVVEEPEMVVGHTFSDYGPVPIPEGIHD
jgi:hypothetical protein